MAKIMKPVKLIYLHGFNSSPKSHKANVLWAYMHKQGLDSSLDIPAIPPVPFDAIDTLMKRVEMAQKKYTVAFAGSSLGGFYATWLAERYGARAVLINPAVRPHLLLEKYLGENINYYTSEQWVLDESHIEQFRRLEVDTISRPERYLLLVQTGDETLDYRDAVKKYAECRSIIEQGGDHSFMNFEDHIEQILDFCGIQR